MQVVAENVVKDRRTDEPGTVALAAHACRGLIITQEGISKTTLAQALLHYNT